MNKKIIGLATACLLSISMVSGGAWAYFSDPEQGTVSLTAGTLDLKTDNQNGVTQTLYSLGMRWGKTIGPKTIVLKNAGSLAGATLDIVFAYIESDGSPNAVNKTADETAAVMQVTTLSYNGADLLTLVGDGNLNGWKDIQDVKNANLTGRPGLTSLQEKNFVITVQMRSDASNDFKGDGIIITMTFSLKQ